MIRGFEIETDRETDREEKETDSEREDADGWMDRSMELNIEGTKKANTIENEFRTDKL